MVEFEIQKVKQAIPPSIAVRRKNLQEIPIDFLLCRVLFATFKYQRTRIHSLNHYGSKKTST